MTQARLIAATGIVGAAALGAFLMMPPTTLAAPLAAPPTHPFTPAVPAHAGPEDQGYMVTGVMDPSNPDTATVDRADPMAQAGTAQLSLIDRPRHQRDADIEADADDAPPSEAVDQPSATLVPDDDAPPPPPPADVPQP